MQQGCEYDVNMGHTIYISGPHHILSNCQNDLPKVLDHWEWILFRLTNICRLLTRRYYKARLLQTCFASRNTEPFAKDIEGFHAHVHSQRWGTTAAAVVQLVAVFPILTTAWNKDLFLHHGQVEQRDAQHSCTNDLLLLACSTTRPCLYDRTTFRSTSICTTLQHSDLI